MRNMKLASYSAIDLLQKKKRLSRELRDAAGLRPIRIAVLGGTTTSELVDLLEVVLLADGFDPVQVAMGQPPGHRPLHRAIHALPARVEDVGHLPWVTVVAWP